VKELALLNQRRGNNLCFGKLRANNSVVTLNDHILSMHTGWKLADIIHRHRRYIGMPIPLSIALVVSKCVIIGR